MQTLVGHRDEVNGMAFHPTCELLATASDDRRSVRSVQHVCAARHSAFVYLSPSLYMVAVLCWIMIPTLLGPHGSPGTPGTPGCGLHALSLVFVSSSSRLRLVFVSRCLCLSLWLTLCLCLCDTTGGLCAFLEIESPHESMLHEMKLKLK